MAYDRKKFDEALKGQYDDMLAQDDKYMDDLVRRVSEGVDSGKAGAPGDRFVHKYHMTNEERLAYYRSHGLDKCDDYPGGDAAFEADVLSGKHHDEDGRVLKLFREDAYIVDRMKDGRFRFTPEFIAYGHNLLVFQAILDNFSKNGFDLR